MAGETGERLYTRVLGLDCIPEPWGFTYTILSLALSLFPSLSLSFLSSIFGAVRTGSYMTYILMTKGLKQSVCDQSFYNGPVSKFWAYAFVLSKAPELGKMTDFYYYYH